MESIKLHYKDGSYLIHLHNRRIEELHKKIFDLFSLHPQQLQLCFKTDETTLLKLDSLSDLELGFKLCDADKPLHIHIFQRLLCKEDKPFRNRRIPRQEQNLPDIDGASSHVKVAQQILQLSGIHIPSNQTKTLLKVLEIDWQNLINLGLGTIENVSRSDAKDKAKEFSHDKITSLILEAADILEDEHNIYGDDIKARPKNDDLTFHNLNGENLCTIKSLAPHKFHRAIQSIAKDPQLEKYLFPGPTYEALAAEGITLRPFVLHLTLRILGITPSHLTNVGLVRPISVAHRDYLFWTKLLYHSTMTGHEKVEGSECNMPSLKEDPFPNTFVRENSKPSTKPNVRVDIKSSRRAAHGGPLAPHRRPHRGSPVPTCSKPFKSQN